MLELVGRFSGWCWGSWRERGFREALLGREYRVRDGGGRGLLEGVV